MSSERISKVVQSSSLSSHEEMKSLNPSRPQDIKVGRLSQMSITSAAPSVVSPPNDSNKIRNKQNAVQKFLQSSQSPEEGEGTPHSYSFNTSKRNDPSKNELIRKISSFKDYNHNDPPVHPRLKDISREQRQQQKMYYRYDYGFFTIRPRIKLASSMYEKLNNKTEESKAMEQSNNCARNEENKFDEASEYSVDSELRSEKSIKLDFTENGDSTPRGDDMKPTKSGFKKTGFFNEKMNKAHNGEDDTYESPSCSQNFDIGDTNDNKAANIPGCDRFRADKGKIEDWFEKDICDQADEFSNMDMDIGPLGHLEAYSKGVKRPSVFLKSPQINLKLL